LTLTPSLSFGEDLKVFLQFLRSFERIGSITLKGLHGPDCIQSADQLFVNPYITVAQAAEILGASNPTARQAVALLEKEGLLKEVSGRAWGRLYLAAPILKAIEGPPLTK
jgi:Fic family protein